MTTSSTSAPTSPVTSRTTGAGNAALTTFHESTADRWARIMQSLQHTQAVAG